MDPTPHTATMRATMDELRSVFVKTRDAYRLAQKAFPVDSEPFRTINREANLLDSLIGGLSDRIEDLALNKQGVDETALYEIHGATSLCRWPKCGCAGVQHIECKAPPPRDGGEGAGGGLEAGTASGAHAEAESSTPPVSHSGEEVVPHNCEPARPNIATAGVEQSASAAPSGEWKRTGYGTITFEEPPPQPAAQQSEVVKSVKFLRDASSYFEKRNTGGEDGAHRANVLIAQNCLEAADLIERLGAENVALRSEVSETSGQIGMAWALRREADQLREAAERERDELRARLNAINVVVEDVWLRGDLLGGDYDNLKALALPAATQQENN